MAWDRGNHAGSLEKSKQSGSEIQGRWPSPEVDVQDRECRMMVVGQMAGQGSCMFEQEYHARATGSLGLSWEEANNIEVRSLFRPQKPEDEL